MMIINVKQTKNVGTRCFNIFYDKSMAYKGSVSAVSALSDCQLLQPNGKVALSTKSSVNFVVRRVVPIVFVILMIALLLVIATLFPPEENSLPMILTIVSVFIGSIIFMLIGSLLKYKRRWCRIFNEDNCVAEFYQQSGGFLLMYYAIAVDDVVYKLYSVSKGQFEYISIYLNDIQVGQINVDIGTCQKRDATIYLLDSHAALCDKLSLFVLYYYSMNHAHRGELKYGKERTWTYSRTNKFYNSSWLTDNFKDVL